MAPRKTKPFSRSKIKEQMGITFSFRLLPREPHQSETESQNSSPVKINDFYLEPSVHTVSSLHLFRRLKRKELRAEAAKRMMKQRPPFIPRKRKGTTTTSIAGECVWCGTHKTAQWRKVSSIAL
jgi:hypothetical protein